MPLGRAFVIASVGEFGIRPVAGTPHRVRTDLSATLFLTEPGDRVTFFPVDAKTFAEQERASEAGEIIAELVAA